MTHRWLLAQAGDDIADVQEQAQSWIDRAVDSLPRIGIAVGVLLVMWGVSVGVRHLLAYRWRRTRTPSFAAVMSRLVGWVIVGLGMLVALVVGFPSIDPVDMVAGLGIVSVAAGFAFQDILSNLLAGLLLIVRQPFISGDQIEVDDHHGTVEGITIRETSITTFDGRRVLIPNRDVYQGAVVIQTAHPAVRSELTVGCSYDDDLEVVTATALTALRSCPGVLREPPPEALLCEFGESTITLELWFWSDPHQIEVRRTQHQVVLATKAAFDRAGLSMPWPIVTLQAGPSMSRALGDAPDAAGDDDPRDRDDAGPSPSAPGGDPGQDSEVANRPS